MATTLTPDALADTARAAFKASGLTQRAAADVLGVSLGTLSNALGTRTGYDAVRVRIVEEWGGVQLEGPVYLVRPVTGPR